ncbi:MAG: DNA adenine methylase [Candidatus Thorarchaeota archaeon]|nr:DNA adenine methylase [Candidatus Thorarchaeota archaeon]
MPRPIVKWAGGKGQLLQDIDSVLPPSFRDYYEPFVGGGALFFHLYRKGLIRKAVLSDANAELISLYVTVRDRVEDIVDELQSGRYVNDSQTYYSIRKMVPSDPVIRAARLIYLNRTCFNGLYRVNSRGQFNVPFGRYENPMILDEANLRAASTAFSGVEFRVGDFEEAVRDAETGDFVYMDPPYVPISDTAAFTSYTKDGFGPEEQERLAHVFSELDERGCYVLESNSATSVIRNLYTRFTVTEVYAARAISSDGSTRGRIPELLIRNYEPKSLQLRLDQF